MSKHLARAISELRSDLVAQFGRVEQMIGLSVRSLVERRSDLVPGILETDGLVNRCDVRIEEECLKILALHQPVSEDLRWVVTVVKINADLERMADLACHIAERSVAIDAYPLFRPPAEINAMVGRVLQMVRQSVDSFISGSQAGALSVIGTDDEVDELYVKIIERLHLVMRSDNDAIEAAVHCFSAARHLERIADIAATIAEETIYLVSGEIVRHRRVGREDAPTT